MDIKEKATDTEILDYMSRHPDKFDIKKEYSYSFYINGIRDTSNYYTDVRKWTSSIMEQEQ